MGTTIIDPHGDVILQGENEGLLVSSRVLILVSPVFEAMIKPIFKEGAAVQMAKGESLTIRLHEDDMEALTLFCKATHHKLHGMWDKPTPSCLQKLAVICDKYKCAGPMQAFGALWLPRETGEIQKLSSEDVGKLLLVAHVFDLPKQFADLAGELLKRQKGSDDKDEVPGLAEDPLKLHGLLEALSQTKREMNLSLKKVVKEVGWQSMIDIWENPEYLPIKVAFKALEKTL